MHFRTRTAPVLLALALAACSDDATAPLAPGAARGTINTVALREDRLAVIEPDRPGAALHLQSLDGKDRVRVSFANVRDRIAGNVPHELLPVGDAYIRALGPAKWSPDGQQLAIVVTLGNDQSQVVVMNADGRNMRTASPNMSVIVGDVEWAPDSRAIAYTMMTNFITRRADLFMTDLVKDEVRRLTTKGQATVWDEYRWTPDGARVLFTEFEGWSDAFERVSRVQSVDRAGVVTGSFDTIVGDPQGLARDGTWALVLRWTRDGGREFLRTPIGKGGEERVLATGDLRYAELLDGDAEAVLVSWPSREGSAYRLMGVQAGDVRAQLPVSDAAVSMALLRARR